jgi:hypothetical protein
MAEASEEGLGSKWAVVPMIVVVVVKLYRIQYGSSGRGIGIRTDRH